MKNLLLFLLFPIVLSSCSKEILQQKLTVSVNPISGGTVSPPSNSYEKGQTIQLLATPAGEYVFKEWKGDLTGNVNPSSLTMNTDKTISGNFEKRQYPLNLTIDGSGTIAEDIIAVATQSQYPSGTTVRLTPQPLEGWAFTGWSGDLTSTANPLDIKVDKPISLKASFEKKIISRLVLKNPIDTLIISKRQKYAVFGVYLDGKEVDLSNEVTISTDNSNVTKIKDNYLVGANKGTVKLAFKYNNLEIATSFLVHNIEFEKVNSKLLSDGNCKITVPIVMINLYPTKDGIIHDESVGPFSYWEITNPTLEVSMSKIKQDLIISKDVVEFGTRYMDRGSNTTTKYVCLNTVAYVNIFNYQNDYYVKIPSYVPYDPRVNTFNYKKMFSDIGLENYVNNKDVKEIWFSYYNFANWPSIVNAGLDDFAKHTYMPETNMSSPITGDISNSYRDNEDLPIYKKSYVVYGNSGHRGVDTNIHNRGHQIESQLRYLERNVLPGEELFWNKFVGVKNDNQKLNGRSGNTHFPPNAESDYDYNNSKIILSDIKNWQPEGGIKSEVNNNTWLNVQYGFNLKATSGSYFADYNNDSQTKWFLYWFQTIPGFGNQLKYNGKQLSNWWDLIFNWDETIKNKKTLWLQ